MDTTVYDSTVLVAGPLGVAAGVTQPSFCIARRVTLACPESEFVSVEHVGDVPSCFDLGQGKGHPSGPPFLVQAPHVTSVPRRVMTRFDSVTRVPAKPVDVVQSAGPRAQRQTAGKGKAGVLRCWAG